MKIRPAHHASSSKKNRNINHLSKPADVPRLRTVTLGTKEFMALADHPSQRDTLRRAKSAQKHHLKNAVEAHRIVSLAEFQGKHYKVDGHTRSHLWAEGTLQMPQTVIATVMRCETEKELLDYYDTFDSQRASKSAMDTVSGSVRFHNLELNSPYLGSYRFNNALRVIAQFYGIYHQFDTRLMVGLFAKELALLDSITPESTIFRSGAVAGSLLLLKRHGEKVLPFLDGINRNAGTKDEGSCDAIFAANHLISNLRATTGMTVARNLAGQIISAGERWLTQRTFPHNRKGVSVKPINVTNYVLMIKKAEEAGIKSESDEPRQENIAEAGLEGVV